MIEQPHQGHPARSRTATIYATCIQELCIWFSRIFLTDDLNHIIGFMHHREKHSYLPSPGGRNLFKFVVIAEDRRFVRHTGFDFVAIARALLQIVYQRKIVGASTLDQQLVRVIRNRYEISFRRKISEIILACALNSIATKDQIFYAYMDVAYFGWRGVGLRKICGRLGYTVENLNPNQAARLAALIKRPMPQIPSERYLSSLRIREAHIWRIIEKSWRE